MSLSNWNPYDDYVQGGMVDGRFQNAAYTMLAAGPPRLANVGGATVLGGTLQGGGAAGDQIAYPMGLIQNFNMGHNMNLTRVFELGSHRSYFIPGRTVGQLQFGRIMYHGPSILRTLYAYYQDLIPPTIVEAVFANAGVATVANPHDVKIPPGYANIYLNLASDIFMQPIGILMMMKDSNEDLLGAGYFEASYVPNHNLGVDAMGTVIQEQVSVQFERMIPVAASTVGLITG